MFRRRTETVADVAVLAIHAFMLLDRGLDEDARDLARRALADIGHGLLGGRSAGSDGAAEKHTEWALLT